MALAICKMRAMCCSQDRQHGPPDPPVPLAGPPDPHASTTTAPANTFRSITDLPALTALHVNIRLACRDVDRLAVTISADQISLLLRKRPRRPPESTTPNPPAKKARPAPPPP
ncbi:hypothetical protein, partial [Bacillus sp. SRB_8]|uniref:hypothetical protein n=1 Tax=Bacillus sp. SRB_8 TaxID=1969377 RepID=UPI001C65FFA7